MQRSEKTSTTNFRIDIPVEKINDNDQCVSRRLAKPRIGACALYCQEVKTIGEARVLVVIASMASIPHTKPVIACAVRKSE